MSTTPAFHALVERIEAFSPGEDSPEGILTLVAETYGMSHAAYLGLELPMERAERQPIFHVTYPKPWIDRYLTENYMRKDPAVLRALKSTLPVDWSKLPLDDKEGERIFREAREFGIGAQGITVPIRGRQGEKALFTIVGDIADDDWEVYKKNFMPDFITIAFYVHCMVLRNLLPHPIQDEVRLSPREILCLEWASNGKTFDDIGEIIGISSHTVRMYLDTARKKLQCVNITHAVARAIKLEIIRAPW